MRAYLNALSLHLSAHDAYSMTDGHDRVPGVAVES